MRYFLSEKPAVFTTLKGGRGTVLRGVKCPTNYCPRLHTCSLNSTIDQKRQNNRQKTFPARSKKLSIILRVCTHACNFCRQAIGFASKITKITTIKSKRSVKQSKESRPETAKYVTLNTFMSSFSAVDYSSGSFLSILNLKKNYINFKSRKIHLETV